MAFLSVALVTALTAGCSSDKGNPAGQAGASQPGAAGAAVAPDMANQDARDFVHHLATVNMAEIDLGKLAAERGTGDEVKKFAQMMIDEHTAADDKLKALASDLKIEAEGKLDDIHKAQRENLARRSGPEFDQEYASAMAEGHKDLIDQLEPRVDKKTLEQWKAGMEGKPTMAGGNASILPDASDNPTTMRINRFAADLYPTVHAHAEAARALESSLKKRQTTP
jgi:putative membrane protein